MTQGLFDRTDGCAVLAGRGWTAERFVAELKGLESTDLLRFRPASA